MTGQAAKKSLTNSIRKRWVSLFPHRTVVRDGIQYRLDCRELIDYHIYFAQWENETVEVIERIVHRGDTTLEIGANVGSHTLLIAQKSGPEGKVHAIEPTLFARQKLIANLELNPDLYRTVHVYDLLVTDGEVEDPRRSIKSSWPSKRNIAEKSDELVVSPAISIDGFIIENGIEKLDFLKIDIDGYDYKALLGGRHTIDRYRPIVYIELCEWALVENGDCVNDIFEFLESRNFVGYAADFKTPLKVNEVLEFIGKKGSVNGLFIPSERAGSILS